MRLIVAVLVPPLATCLVVTSCPFALHHCLCLQFRKPKALKFGVKINKVSDLKCYHLATILARQHGSLTEQSLMLCGGEMFELKRHALANIKLTDNSQSLEIRVSLAKELQWAEKRWRDRLLSILTKGRVKMSDYKATGNWHLFSTNPASEFRMANKDTELFIVCRLMSTVFKQGCKSYPAVAGMTDLSVIGQHSSTVSLRRPGESNLLNTGQNIKF